MAKNTCILFLFLTFIFSGKVVGSTSYHIGNSLTWDMQPAGLVAMAALTGKTHQVGYHIRSGMHLDYIWSNPDDSEVITNSFGNYVNALPSFKWDFVTIQPYYRSGSTLGQDQAAISNFIDLTLSGPSASPVFYIYSAWPSLPDDYQTSWNQPIQNDPDQQTIHAREYFYYLYQNLLNQYGSNIQLYLIPIGEVLYRLDQAFKQGNISGFDTTGDLYRDVAHLTKDVGRFAAVTTVYSTLFRENPEGTLPPIGYYLNDDGATKLTEELRNLIQSVVWDVVSHHSLSGVDVTPDDFTLGKVTDSELSTMLFSKQISVAGINALSDISITGGEYSINGNKFTNTSGVISDGDTVVLRLVSSGNYSTKVVSLLTIGGISDSFSVTTINKPAAKNTGSINIILIMLALIGLTGRLTTRS